MNIKLLSINAKVPTKGSELAAGYDLYVSSNTVVNPGRNVIPLDIAIEIPMGCEGHIRPRSGFSAKGIEGMTLSSNDSQNLEYKRFDADVLQGTIDADYVGNIGVIIKSYEPEPFLVTAGTRIAQMVISTCLTDTFTIVDDLNNTKRGDGGFGHTGTH